MFTKNIILLNLFFLIFSTIIYSKQNINKYEIEAQKIDQEVKAIDNYIQKQEDEEDVYEVYNHDKSNKYIFKNDICLKKIIYDSNKKNELFFNIDDSIIKTNFFITEKLYIITYYKDNKKIMIKTSDTITYYKDNQRIKKIEGFESTKVIYYDDLIKEEAKRNTNPISKKLEDKYFRRYKNNKNFNVIDEDKDSKNEVIYKNGELYKIIDYDKKYDIRSEKIYKKASLIEKIEYFKYEITKDFYKNAQKIKNITYNTDNSTKKSETFYDNEKIIKYIEYYKSKISSIIEYKDGEYIRTNYDDKNIIEKTYFNGDYNANIFYKKIEYYKTGEVSCIFEGKRYPKTHRAYKAYIKNLKSEKSLIYNSIYGKVERNGKESCFYKSGNKKSMIEKAYFIILNNEIYWYENGNKSYQINYSLSGSVKSIKTWNINGKLIFSGYLKNNKLYNSKNNKLYTGKIIYSPSKYYFLNEKIYQNGQLVKFIYYFHKNIISEEQIYENNKYIMGITYNRKGEIFQKHYSKGDNYIDDTYSNGKLRERFLSNKNNKQGKHIIYDDIGNKTIEENYDSEGKIIK